jgi:UDP-N-acetylglucosamine--N-acetylmuramyl-(pentapeptide) pyrophosphoryl-undecaprenol N-acetylglucosamine transferase
VSLKILIAGGGTGGHIFPAIAIANALKKKNNRIEFLFVGAKGKMEMEKVPLAGYKIQGLDIAGFNRSSLIKNIGLPLKLLKSFVQVKKIVNQFKPDAVIGVGGYSSFPVLRFAQVKKIPTFIHESNSFAGKSNRLLGKMATKIFVAIDGMDVFFPANKLMITGNPVRSSISNSSISRTEAIKFFSLDETKKTVLVVGGSLGAKSINEAIDVNLDELLKAGLQVIWQTGKPYESIALKRSGNKNGVCVNAFITHMEKAYAAADIVVARSGAMTVAELCVAKKPVIFIPYPYAAEDHQTVNAQQLVNKKAAMMIKDSEVKEKLVSTLIDLAGDNDTQQVLKNNIEKLAIKDADERIADEILNLISEHPSDDKQVDH